MKLINFFSVLFYLFNMFLCPSCVRIVHQRNSTKGCFSYKLLVYQVAKRFVDYCNSFFYIYSKNVEKKKLNNLLLIHFTDMLD